MAEAVDRFDPDIERSFGSVQDRCAERAIRRNVRVDLSRRPECDLHSLEREIDCTSGDLNRVGICARIRQRCDERQPRRRRIDEQLESRVALGGVHR